jgi:hypothetical protein
MQATDDRECHDTTVSLGHSRQRLFLPEALVWPRLVVEAGVLRDEAQKMALAKHEDMVEPSGTSSRFHGLSRRAAAFTQSPFSVGFITTIGVLCEACCARPFLVRTGFVANTGSSRVGARRPFK